MRSPASRRLVVIGAGIVGVSTALHALRRGWSVTLVDPRGVSGGASSGNAGIIATSEVVPVGTPSTIKSVPRMLLSRDGPLHIRPSYFPRLLPWLVRMLLASTPRNVERLSVALADILADAVPAHEELAQEAGVRSSLVRSGWLKAYETEGNFSGAAGDYGLMRRRGIACDELDAAGIEHFEPGLRGCFSRAIFHPDCHHVGEPAAYVQALGAHLRKSGVSCVQNEVTAFETRSDHVTGVRMQHTTLEADAVVIAAGAWSRRLCAQLGSAVPLDTERGYHMMLDASGCKEPLRHPLYWAEKSIVLSPMGHSLRVTSSVEFAGIDAEPDYDLVLRYLPDVQRLLPGIAGIPTNTWLGFRPSIPDSLPVIGRTPAFRNAFLGFGHGHLGLTLGPVTGKLLGALLDSEATSLPLEPFSPARF